MIVLQCWFRARKTKGAEGLIEIANPNRVQQKQKKVTALGNDSSGGKPQLSRREREEVEKQRAKANYQKMHAAGKTEEARQASARWTASARPLCHQAYTSDRNSFFIMRQKIVPIPDRGQPRLSPLLV